MALPCHQASGLVICDRQDACCMLGCDLVDCGKSIASSVPDEFDEGTPVDLTGCDDLKCDFCGAHVTSPTPLMCLALRCKFGTTMPWSRYKTVKQPGTGDVRKPVTRFCLLCKNTHMTLGLDDKFPTVAVYYKHCAKVENAHLARAFVKMVGAFIKAHNDSGNDGQTQLKLKTSKELNQQHQRLVTSQIQAIDLIDDNSEFVLKEAWNEKLDGKWDPDKAVMHSVFGEMKEGAWVLRGRVGVHAVRTSR